MCGSVAIMPRILLSHRPFVVRAQRIELFLGALYHLETGFFFVTYTLHLNTLLPAAPKNRILSKMKEKLVKARVYNYNYYSNLEQMDDVEMGICTLTVVNLQMNTFVCSSIHGN